MVDQVTIDLTFLTDTSSFDLISDVHLRNPKNEDTMKTMLLAAPP